MRLASFNVENLFDRAKALNGDTWAEGRPVLEKFAQLNALLGEPAYSATDRTKMAQLMIDLGLEKSDTGPFVILRRNRGKLLKRPKTGGIEIIAASRADWVGSLELRVEPVNQVAMQNTARVINDLAPDVLGVVEAESRPVLNEFSKVILPVIGGTPFPHVMLIDGNDERGIDVGLLTRPGYMIDSMRSHVDDADGNGQLIFSRDCAEYSLTTPSGASLLLLVNHFKSKGYGGQAASDARRRKQAERVKAIYEGRRAEGVENIAVIGDFNDAPDGAPLQPLLAHTDLQDISAYPGFNNGGRPGTFGASTASNKIDYILLSPALFARVKGGGIFRKGMWPGVQPKKWDAYPELTREEEAASDHGAIYADFDL
ncbi:MAG: endonuclease/exonuclease/phosphatase [Sphingobium sp.]|jgi:endonuclease/exonuclease/phosphatase family metal-dependent hydrolase|nr:MAG: endonuclease/exonuclease/phosphatase [Sphingobium sp.]